VAEKNKVADTCHHSFGQIRIYCMTTKQMSMASRGNRSVIY